MIYTREKIVAAYQLSTTDESTIVAIGHFDVIRAEHCRLLQQARNRATRLVAVVLSDAPDRASLLDHQARANLTAALDSVDHVVMCDAAEASQLVTRLGASATLDIDAQLKRDVIADVLQRQSEGQ